MVTTQTTENMSVLWIRNLKLYVFHNAMEEVKKKERENTFEAIIDTKSKHILFQGLLTCRSV